MYIFRNILLCLPFTLALAACSGMINQQAGPKPDWVDGTSESYPDSTYLLAIGHDRYLKSAKRSATSSLMKKFIPNQDPVLQVLKTKETEALVNGMIESVKKRIQIVDSWYNEENSQYYVLAILHRAQAAEDLRKHIKTLDEAAGHHIEKSASRRDKLGKIFHAGTALYQQTLRSHYAALYHELDRQHAELRQIWTIASLRDSFNKLLNRVFVQTRIANDDLGVLRQSLLVSLKKLGFSEASGNYLDYLFESSLNIDDQSEKKGKFITEATLMLRIRDPEGKVIGERTWPLTLETSSKSRDAQTTAGTRAVGTLLQQELLKTVLELSIP